MPVLYLSLVVVNWGGILRSTWLDPELVWLNTVVGPELVVVSAASYMMKLLVLQVIMKVVVRT
jgi:hypothetical protein